MLWSFHGLRLGWKVMTMCIRCFSRIKNGDHARARHTTDRGETAAERTEEQRLVEDDSEWLTAVNHVLLVWWITLLRISEAMFIFSTARILQKTIFVFTTAYNWNDIQIHCCLFLKQNSFSPLPICETIFVFTIANMWNNIRFNHCLSLKQYSFSPLLIIIWNNIRFHHCLYLKQYSFSPLPISETIFIFTIGRISQKTLFIFTSVSI